MSVVELRHIFTNLFIIEEDRNTKEKKPIDYTDLINIKANDGVMKRILIQGEAGVGKTTLCAKIVWDWVNGERYQEFTIVPVVLLREVKKGQTIGGILITYLQKNTITAEQLDQYIEANEDKILTLLDGLDELGLDMPESHEDIVNILQCVRYRKSTTIVTTRPWKAHFVTNSTNLSKQYACVCIEGFTMKNVHSYIGKFFNSNKSAAKGLVQFLKEGNLLSEIMAPFPIFCSMLCHLWKKEERRQAIRKLQTFSQIFFEIISFLKEHHAAKQFDTPSSELVNVMMNQIESHFKDISKIAFTGLLKDQLCFDGEVFESCRDAQRTACEIGILTEETGLTLQGFGSGFKRPRIARNVSFPHKLFQEFMAGLHLVDQFQTNRTEYERILNTVIMLKANKFQYLLYFATSQLQPVGQDIISKLTKDTAHLTTKRQKHLDFIMEVAFECHDKETSKLVEQNLSSECKAIELKRSMSAHVIAGYLYTLEQVVSSLRYILPISRFYIQGRARVFH